MLNKIKLLVDKLFKKKIFKLENNLHKTLILLSNLKSVENLKHHRIDNLSNVEYTVFSQSGEDGILDWLINNVKGIPKTFVEFGCNDYDEANTRLILENFNWSGLIIDNDINNINKIKKQNYFWKRDLLALCEFITKDNINELIKKNKNFKDVGILSIDIDGNDYWVWKNINVIKPSIVICEYNAVFGDKLEITVPYKNTFNRSKEHFSNLYFGSSIKGLVELGKRKGYECLGSNSFGNNVFFIRKDLYKFISNKIKHIKIFPSKFRESRNSDYSLSYLSGSDRLDQIKNLKVYDLKSEKMIKIKNLRYMYSDEWMSGEPKVILK